MAKMESRGIPLVQEAAQLDRRGALFRTLMLLPLLCALWLLALPALCAAAARLDIPLRVFPADELARCVTPTPSEAAGRRFHQPPFSVCEAAALLAARADGHSARLLLSKIVVQERLTLAVALASPPATSTPNQS